MDLANLENYTVGRLSHQPQPPMKTKIPRRSFLKQSALGTAALGTMTANPFARAQEDPTAKVKFTGAVTAREYLKSILYTKDEVK